jgi:hypothetical protein
MALKSAFVAAICTGLLALGGVALADEYGAGQFLGLDLSKAVLSPKRLGPETQFAPVPIEANADRGSDARADVKADRKTVVRTTKVTAAPVKMTMAPVEHRRGAARVKLAKRHGNPLDAQARDTRIQTWPCRSGGICNWQR